MNNSNNPFIFQRTIFCSEIIDLVSAQVHTIPVRAIAYRAVEVPKGHMSTSIHRVVDKKKLPKMKSILKYAYNFEVQLKPTSNIVVYLYLMVLAHNVQSCHYNLNDAVRFYVYLFSYTF